MNQNYLEELMSLPLDLDLSLVPEGAFEQVPEMWQAGDIAGILFTMGDNDGFEFVFSNLDPLKRAGLYESALFQAYIGIRLCPPNLIDKTGIRRLTPHELQSLFQFADRCKLRKQGDPLPGEGPFTLYRGVMNIHNTKNIRSISWTASPHIAAWFATRFKHLKEGYEPGVYRITVPEENVFFYTNERSEQEFVVELPSGIKARRVQPMPEPYDPKKEN